MKLREIYPNVYQIDLGIVNCYLIDEQGLTLIDTGYARNTPDILKAIQKIGKKPADIRQIILTHLHPDHAGGAAILQQHVNVPVYAHKADTNLIRQGICSRPAVQVTPGFMNWCLYKAVVWLGPKSIMPVQRIEPLDESDVFPVLSGLQIIHTPGHSEGHISLWASDKKLLFAGDVLVNSGGLKPAPVYEDVAVGEASVKKLAAYAFDMACFGQGNPISNANQQFSRVDFGK